MNKNTSGFLIDIRRDDGMGIGTWFDNEDDAIEYENVIWKRGYVEGESPTQEDGKAVSTRYPIAKCQTSRLALSFEHYAQGRDINGKPPFTTTYNWEEWENHMEHKDWNDKKDGKKT